MKTIKSICSIVLAGCLLLAAGQGCRDKARTSGEERPGDSSADSPELRFDPLELTADMTVVPGEYPNTTPIRSVDSVAGDIDSESVLSPFQNRSDSSTIDSLDNQVFRVQLFTTKVYGEARRARQTAEEIFDRPVYLDYEVPYYKLRVGSFADRSEAEDYQQRAKAAGYTNAWVAMVNINVNELPSLYDTLIPAGDDPDDSYGPNEEN